MIGLLNAYHFDKTPGSYQEKYEPLFLRYLQRVMPQSTIKTYQVAQNQFPKDLNECDGWIISGSPASAYDSEEWIENLLTFTKDCHKEKKKILGVCFGHQIIGKALGGEVTNSDKGWGVGVRDFKIIKEKEWMIPKLESDCSLLFSHQDQVTKLPPKALNLGSDSFCEFQMFSIDEHIFSMQGHPEFTPEYARERYSTRKEILGETTYKDGIDSLKNQTDELIVGKWIKNFFG